MYERLNERLLTRAQFVRRVIAHAALSLTGVAIALGIGIGGYHYLAGLGWIDSFLNASMILGGMGPVDPLHTPGSKIFAGAYALFAGLVFVALSGLLFAPFFHRLLHRFHLDEEDETEGGSDASGPQRSPSKG